MRSQIEKTITTGSTARTSASGRRYTRAPNTNSSGSVISRHAPSNARYCRWSISAPSSCVRGLDRDHPIQRADSLRTEDLAESSFLLLAETAGDQLRMGADESLADSVHR